jgi:hydrogenase maturation protein HypF
VSPAVDAVVRARARVRGSVQGVGFRPYVHRLARELALAGWVRNDSRDVTAEGRGGRDRRVLRAARRRGAAARARRGPYDRSLTTMAGFAMCRDCRREYDDPADRRFHAQPNACPVCGPNVRLLGRDDADPIEAAARALADGLVVAVKGVGGYHLACDAADEKAVRALRTRKHREHRPFALMARDLAAAHELVELTPEDEELLCSRARPIVLAARRPGANVASGVAPATPELGVMLPYSPLHHLLLADVAALGGGPLVLTSGNVSDEPIAYVDADALERLAGIADLFFVHDRPIHIRTDDSVVRTVRGRPLVIRRSRGHVPDATALPVPARRTLLAVGADQKNTFCVAKDARAWVGHHIGDLEHFATHTAFREGIEHFERLVAAEPAVVAHDLHPDYLSTAYALEREGVELVGVQHHHAHLAACIGEHGLDREVVGAIYDGTGYGTDGTVWGGELLVGGLRGFERVGFLRPVRLPGGAAAIREPWRMACAWLAEAFGGPQPLPASLRAHVDPLRWDRVAELAVSGLASPVTTSMGRLFDAVAALCGIAPFAGYEGQAAVELEAAADPRERGAYAMPGLDPRETIRRVVSDLDAGVEPGAISARFHAAVADATVAACAAAARSPPPRRNRAQRRRVPEPPPAGGGRRTPRSAEATRARTAPAAAERRRHLVRPGRDRRGARRLAGGVEEPGLVGEHDRLHAVAEAELGEDVRDVRLHGRLADEELAADLVVREAARDQAEDVELALGQLAELLRRGGVRDARELLDHAPRHGGGEERVAARDGADRGEELLGRVVLEHEAAGARAQRLVDVLVEVEGGQDQDARGVVGGEDAPRRLEPVELRHADVHQDHGGPEARGLVDRLEPVRRLRHDLDVVLAAEQHPEARADHRLVVDDEDADAHAGPPPSGSRVLSTKPPPSAVPVVSSPP